MPNQKEKKLSGFKPEEQLEPQVEVEIPKEKEPTEISTEISTEEKINVQEKPRFKIPKIKRRPTQIPNYQDPQVQKIEKILEQGLGDSFSRLSPIAKQEFKIKGEQVATKINELMKKTHVKAKKILKLIFEWLRILPGINKFFLEQEAKIKTDEIISLKNRK